MPNKPNRPCRYPTCPRLTNDKSGYCEYHRILTSREYDRQRGNSTQRGYDYRWARIRRVFLNEHPLCQDCLDSYPQVIREATEVHHIKALRDGGTHNQDNLIALCRGCHSRRTAKEQGFAHRR